MIAHRSTLVAALSLALSSCGSGRAPLESPARPSTETQRGGANAEPAPSTAAPASAGAPTGPAPAAPPPLPVAAGTPCGALGCLHFTSPAAAFASIVAQRPRVLAIGESHALADSQGIESVTRRFTNQLLPWLEGRASSLVVELLLPDPRCRGEATVVREEQKVVTEKQATGNQNEFVDLGHRARALRIEPFPLRPSCAELSKVADAGPDTVVEMLLAITRLTDASVRRLLARDAAAGREAIVVPYGGAMHNDLLPRPGREAWSFGPALSEHTGGRYIELDLIVPEYIKDTEAWRALPWYTAYDRGAHGSHTVLFNPSERSYVLIFPWGTGVAAGEPPVESAP